MYSMPSVRSLLILETYVQDVIAQLLADALTANTSHAQQFKAGQPQQQHPGQRRILKHTQN